MKLQCFHLFPMTLSPAVAADTAYTVEHECVVESRPVVPKGLIVTKRSKAGELYYDISTWTSSTITVSSSAAQATYNILLIV